ncbi:MAG: hypothetical protein GKC01_03890 [Candidatus Methanofastidiosa archaeon]|nr:hypothetical protein [Candidatus Methanofastidiosa archaeon]
METFERDFERAKEDFNKFVSSSGKDKLGRFADVIQKEIDEVKNIIDTSAHDEEEKVRMLRAQLSKCDNMACEERNKNRNIDYTPLFRIIENLKYGVDEYESRVEY